MAASRRNVADSCRAPTCHVYVDEAWIDKIGKANERDDPTEAEMLESAACPPTAFSRLSCQITLTDS